MNIEFLEYHDGIYGTENDTGNLLYCKFNLRQMETIQRKEIILLIDISASMNDSFKMVKSSVLAFLKLIDLTKIRVKIYTFCQNTELVFDTFQDNLYDLERIISQLKTKCMTNLGDALIEIFAGITDQVPVWLIILTDGDSNHGPYRSVRSFSNFISGVKFNNLKTITLGYGDDFNPEILNLIGEFTYVQSEEHIPYILGNIVKEIDTYCLSSLKISLPEEVNSEGALWEKKIDPNREEDQLIIGSYEYKFLSNDRDYYFGLLCPASYSYMVINGKNHEINNTNLLREEIKQKYFESEKERILFRIYKNYRRRNYKYIEQVKVYLENWNNSEKEEILYLIENLETKSLNPILDQAVNTGYSVLIRNRYVDQLIKLTDEYLESPMINVENNL